MIKRVAIFGGSFNPPHKGHGKALSTLSNLDFIDEVWVVPSEDCHYKDLTPISLRISMLELWVSELEEAKVLKIKVKFWSHSNPQHYSITSNLINDLEIKYPNHKFYFSVGADQAVNIPNWLGVEPLLKREEFFLIMSRPGHTEHDLDFPHISIESKDGIEISSTRIKEQIINGETSIEGITPKVLDFIIKNGMYT